MVSAGAMVRICGVIVIVLAAIFLFPLKGVSGESREPPPNCVSAGVCTLCNFAEAGEPYCAATSRRQEFVCRSSDDEQDDDSEKQGPSLSRPDALTQSSRSGRQEGADSAATNAKEALSLEQKKKRKKRGPHVEFLSCDSTPDDDLRAVAWFEVWMTVFFALSMWGVKVQKNKNLTLYDVRKRKIDNSSSSGGGGSSGGRRSVTGGHPLKHKTSSSERFYDDGGGGGGGDGGDDEESGRRHRSGDGGGSAGSSSASSLSTVGKGDSGTALDSATSATSALGSSSASLSSMAAGEPGEQKLVPMRRSSSVSSS